MERRPRRPRLGADNDEVMTTPDYDLAAGAPETRTPKHRLAEHLWLWMRRATVVGLAASLMMHVLGVGVAGRLGISSTPGGGSGAGNGAPVEFAIVTEGQLSDLEQAALGDVGGVPEITSTPAAESALERLDASPGASSNSDLRTGGELTLDAGGGGNVGSGEGSGEGLGIGGGSGGGGGGASFFGVEARGSRFVFIIDVSSSMLWEGKAEAMKAELVRSIEAMPENNSFSVVLYSDTAIPLGDRKQWVEASESGKRWARRSIVAIKPEGGTNPPPAFVIGLGMRPRPDAIYFMTDGEFPETMASEIIALNSQLHVPIHCLCFVTKDAESQMKTIARLSGGTYTFVPKPGK